MQRLETSREFFAKTQRYIHIYVNKLEGLLARLLGRVYMQVVGSLQGVMSKIYKTQIRSRDYGVLQGVFRKTIIFFPGFKTEQGDGVLLAALSIGAAGAPGHGGLRGEGKTKREERGFRGGAHLVRGGAADGRRRPAMAAGSVRKGRRRSGVEEVTVRG
jgi:hypothetical protein